MDWWSLFYWLSMALTALYFASYFVDVRYYGLHLFCLGCRAFGRVYHGKDHLATQEELENSLAEQIAQQAKDFVRKNEPRTAGEVTRGEKKRVRNRHQEYATNAAMEQVFIETRGHVTQIIFEGRATYVVPFGKRWTMADEKKFPSFYSYCEKYFEKNKKKE